MNDLRLALRVLVKNPGFSAVAILSLALGIGANTTIFSLLNGLLLTPTPGKDPSRLVSVYTSDSSGPLYSASSYPDYLDFKSGVDALEDLAAHTLQPVLLTVKGESQRAVVDLMTGNTFEMLGLRAAYGRTLLRSEETPGSYPVVVLSHAFWRSRFGADPSTVGQTIAVNGHPHTIVGVGPEGFSGLFRGVSADMFLPLAMHDVLTGDTVDNRGNRGLLLLGRLREGATVESTRAALGVVAKRLHESYRANWTNKKGEPRVVSVLPESESRVLPMMAGSISAFLGVLLSIVGFVLLLACSNVANLLLARANARKREIAVRVALGASRLQLIRQLLAESVLLSVVAGVLGLAIAFVAMRVIGGIQPPLPVSLALGMELDPRVLLFTLLLSVGTGIVFGLLPALGASRVGPMEALRSATSQADRARWFGARHLLVVGQVAGSVLLLVCTGLFLRSLGNAEAIDPGFVARGVSAFSVDLASRGYDEARGPAFFEQMRDRLLTVPGVVDVGMASRVPLSLDGGRRSLGIEGYTAQPGEDLEVHFSEVSPGYFETMKTPLTSGRAFARTDATGPGVVVVNEAFVRRYWPGKQGIGQRVVTHREFGGKVVATPMEVVGIAKDGKYNSLGEEPTPFIYYPQSHFYNPQLSVLLRTDGPAPRVTAEVRRAMASLDSSLPLFDFKTLEQHLGLALFPVRAVAWLLGLMGSLALFLAVLGLHGVLSYSVSRRTREIGIRMALGARREAVLQMIVGFGARLSVTGVALGVIAALGATRFLTFLLYGISPLDPLTFVLVPGLLLAVSLGAAAFPARRAASIEPVEALREE